MSTHRSSSGSFLFLVLIILIFIPLEHIVQDFHERTVTVEYKHFFFSEDTLDLTFYAPGTYIVQFSATEGHKINEKQAPLPHNLKVTVTEDDDLPVEKHLTQHALPSYFDVTVTAGEGDPETAHFK